MFFSQVTGSCLRNCFYLKILCMSWGIVVYVILKWSYGAT